MDNIEEIQNPNQENINFVNLYSLSWVDKKLKNEWEKIVETKENWQKQGTERKNEKEQEIEKKTKDLGLELKDHKFAYYLAKNNPSFVKFFESSLTNEELKELKTRIIEESWKDINKNFEYKWRIEWEKRAFDKGDCRKWINIGLKPTEAIYAQKLRDVEQETPEEINKKPNKEKYLKRQCQKYKNELIQLLSLHIEERLSNWNIDFRKFIEDYAGEKIVYLAKTVALDGIYNIIRDLNIISGGAVALLQTTENIDQRTGGIIQSTNAGVGLLLPYIKDKLLGLNKREELFKEFINDLENIYKVGDLSLELYDSALFLVPFSEELNEVIDVLRIKIDKFFEKKDKYLEMANWYGVGSSRLILNPIRTAKSVWNDVEEYSEGMCNAVETKRLVEILKQAFSEYFWGVSEQEINKKIQIEKIKLLAVDPIIEAGLSASREEKKEFNELSFPKMVCRLSEIASKAILGKSDGYIDKLANEFFGTKEGENLLNKATDELEKITKKSLNNEEKVEYQKKLKIFLKDFVLEEIGKSGVKGEDKINALIKFAWEIMSKKLRGGSFDESIKEMTKAVVQLIRLECITDLDVKSIQITENISNNEAPKTLFSWLFGKKNETDEQINKPSLSDNLERENYCQIEVK